MTEPYNGDPLYQILVDRENDANKEKKSATLRRREKFNLDLKSSKGKSADFTEQNCSFLKVFSPLNLFPKVRSKSRLKLRSVNCPKSLKFNPVLDNFSKIIKNDLLDDRKNQAFYFEILHVPK